LTFGSTAGDGGAVRGKRRLPALQMMLADFGESALRIHDQLSRDVLHGLERTGIDVLEQHIVDETDERRDARHLLLAVRLQEDPDAAFIDRARPFHQKACFFKSPDLGRHMGRGKRDVIGEFADRDPTGALRVGDPHQYDELAGREVELLAEGIPAGEQAPDALHHRVDAAAKLGV
jgi:hypothetical protein